MTLRGLTTSYQICLINFLLNSNSENYPNQFSLPYSSWRVKILTFYFQRALTYICVVFIYQFRSSFIEYLFPTE